MMHKTDILQGELIVKLPVKDQPFATLAEAAAARTEGKRVAMEADHGRFYVMDQFTTFQTNFDAMVKARWIILD